MARRRNTRPTKHLRRCNSVYRIDVDFGFLRLLQGLAAVLDLLLNQTHHCHVIEFGPLIHFDLLDRGQHHAHRTLAHLIPAPQGVFHGLV